MKRSTLLFTIGCSILGLLLLISFTFNMLQASSNRAKNQQIKEQGFEVISKDSEIANKKKKLEQCQAVARGSERFVISISNIFTGTPYQEPNVTVADMQQCYNN